VVQQINVTQDFVVAWPAFGREQPLVDRLFLADSGLPRWAVVDPMQTVTTLECSRAGSI
jgi:hypothetical protein